MPIYQYECQEEDCGHDFEELQSIKAPPLTKCPKCGKNTLKKVLSAPGLIFKGSGFYVNDYPKDNRGNS